MYFLGADNCVYSAANTAQQLVCQVTDFEVRVDGYIIALTDSTAADVTNDGKFTQDPTSFTYYTKYNNKKGLTLARGEEPIFIGDDNKVDA